MTNTSVLSFDLDDTLWENAQVIQRALRKLFTALSATYPKIAAHLSYDDFIAIADHVDIQWPMTAHRIAHLHRIFTEIGFSNALALEHATQWTERYRRWRSQVQCYPGVLPLLIRLREHYRLIAITNGNVDARQIGLYGLFDTIFYAEEMNLSKAQPELYKTIGEQFDEPKTRFIHIGDHWRHDVCAPTAAGWQAIWINADNAETPETAPNGYLGYIQHVLKLPEFLALISCG